MDGFSMQSIGLDLASVGRFQRLLDRYGLRLAQRILAPPELAQFEQVKRDAQFLASRWSAKEALYKAVGGSAPGQLLFNEIELVSGGGGVAPHFSAGSTAWKAALKDASVCVSLTHEPGLGTDSAMAAAVAPVVNTSSTIAIRRLS